MATTGKATRKNQRRGKNEAASLEPEDAGPFGAWNLPGLDYPSFRISLIAKIMDRLSIRYLAHHSTVSIAEWRVIARLTHAEGGLTVRQIAEQAWVDRAEVSRAASSLERHGLVRKRPNPKDGRAPFLFVTAKGKALYRPLLAARDQFHERIVSDLSAKERETLDALLQKIARTLLTIAEEDISQA